MEEQVDTEAFPSFGRSTSPSPSIPPTPAISSCPSPDRTFSSVSSLSTSSATSADARSTGSSKRRGYIRPQGAEFAESARHRESVLSLGSIAHLQYYFARTGLLEGKGGHAREYQKKKRPENVPRLLLTPNARFVDDMTESPTEDEILDPAVVDENEEVMLPPTVSTYSIKTHYIPPPPDLLTLRKDLLDAVANAQKSIELAESEKEGDGTPDTKPPRISVSPDGGPEGEEPHPPKRGAPMTSWHEIQGMRILDLVTLAIRAAKIYYTAHERPERLAAIKNEREIRQALFHVLDVLKRWASRNFAGGLRVEERAVIMGWMSDVRATLAHESQLESEEVKEREGWHWAYGDWSGREREREECFLQSLMDTGEPLPTWESTDDRSLPTPFLEHLCDGRDLVRIHNKAVKKSKRPFCEISAFHEDVAKPYRRAENLRYWVKAAEIRWETRFELDVMGVVHGSNDHAWRQFDAALLAWCRAVREELTRDWQDTKPGTGTGMPDDALEAEKRSILA